MENRFIYKNIILHQLGIQILIMDNIVKETISNDE